MTAQMAPQSGQCLGDRYRLVERIAVGGMGEVWRGVDEVLARQVAVKVLRTDLGTGDPFRQRFRTEARVAAMLSHPHIAQMYDYGETERSAYLVMELVPGEPLSTLITRHQTLGSDRTLGLMAQAARGLHAAHERGVVHRDVKPANVLVTPEGRVKITDFGIARPQDHQNLTATGQVMGTAHYLAPEVARGATATALADIYALGVVTYECLAGWRPFDGPNQVAVATAHLRQPPPPLPDTIGPDLRALVFQVLEKDPAKRPQTALVLAEMLESLRRRPRTASRPAVAAAAGAATASTSVLAPLAVPGAAGTAAAAGAAAAGGALLQGRNDAAAPVPGGAGGPTGPAGSAWGEPSEPDDEEERRRRPLLVLLAGGVLALVAILGLWGAFGGDNPAVAGQGSDPSASPSPSGALTDPTQTSPQTSPTTPGPSPTATAAPSVTVTVTPSAAVTTVVKVEPQPQPTTKKPANKPTTRSNGGGGRPATTPPFSYKPGVEYINLSANEYTGQDAGTAQRILNDRGFPSVRSVQNGSGVPAGTVLRISPSGTLAKGTLITVVVSGGR